jgi:hypothetical protein
MNTTAEEKKKLPTFLPVGWKLEVSKRIGVHPKSMCRILRNPRSKNYNRIIKIATELYGK